MNKIQISNKKKFPNMLKLNVVDNPNKKENFDLFKIL